ncbi:hypothetical protein F1737_02245 [Methanoplanus sp. FWC-SCC4]|uniref:Uncharacterized protein n=1 Tax=Methanochimaera problematica TaxID=2609417 RepID=A0AA97I3T5_9EURY|nr:hypothetical protein [Methanoplanus sp. FWC-SCC4]WOF15586.1 hypothetical protein F1737_02245 [Methanoplanus sp. FWC-SCC4]
MKKEILFLISIVLALCLVHSVGAANFDTPVVKFTPSQNSYSPGDSVSVSVDVKLASSGDSTFPAAHSLEAYTELDDPSWEYTVKINGHGESQSSTRSFLTLTGYLLDYPSASNEVIVSYRMEGTVPEVSSTGEKIFFQLSQIDGSGNTVSGGEVVYKKLVLNPGDIDKLRGIVETSLATFNTQIQDKLKIGVDIKEAQAKYDSAREKFIKSATASYSDANTYLSEAQTLIDEGTNLLNKAWAQKAIDDAQAKIDSTAFYITDFKVNRSMNNDARVINIETKIESAQSSLNSAKSLMNDGNYPQAYTVAESAHSKASEALTVSEELYEEVSKGFIPDIGGIGIFVVIGIIVIIAIVGIILYRRQTSWDELG